MKLSFENGLELPIDSHQLLPFTYENDGMFYFAFSFEFQPSAEWCDTLKGFADDGILTFKTDTLQEVSPGYGRYYETKIALDDCLSLSMRINKDVLTKDEKEEIIQWLTDDEINANQCFVSAFASNKACDFYIHTSQPQHFLDDMLDDMPM